METFIILKEAIKKVPFLKYALGLVGVAAGIAIIKSFGIDNYQIPITSICFFLFLMILLFIFSKIANSKDKASRYAGYILIYLTVTIICLASILFTTSIFFDFPKPINNYPFFAREKVAKDSVEHMLIPTDKKVRGLDSNNESQNIPLKPKKAITIKPQKTTDSLLEISIQLAVSSKGYDFIKINGNFAEVLASSTPFNPRLFVESKADVIQFIEIFTKAGDTCTIKQIFNKTEKQFFPIRFVPECKNQRT